MRFFKGFYKALDWLCKIIIVIGLGAIVVILGLQMVIRVVAVPFMWAEEVCRYLFVTLAFIGAGRAFSKGGHLTVDIFFIKFPKKLQLALLFLYYAVIIVFTGYLFYSGIQLAKFQWKMPMYTVPSFMLGWVDLCIPFGCGIAILYILRELYYMIKKGTGYLDTKGGALE